MKKVSSKKGFTLAELLIVVAIIAVLVAIAVPVFGTSLNKARHAADLSAVRAEYSEKVVDAMTSDDFISSGEMEIYLKTPVDPGNKSIVSVNGQVVTVTSAVDNKITGSFTADSDVTVKTSATGTKPAG